MLCRGQGAQLPQIDSLIVHMKGHLHLPYGVDLIGANNRSSATGTWAVEYRVYGMDFSVKVHPLFLVENG